MKLIQHVWRYGDLSVDEDGEQIDRERSVLPSLMIATMNCPPDRITAIGVGWWKWGIRLSVHTRTRSKELEKRR